MPGMTIKPPAQWFDATGMRRDVNKEVTTCADCGCQWMELIRVLQYPKHHQVVLGQRPAAVKDVGYWLFKCPKCNEIFEPEVMVGMQDSNRKDYDEFLNHMVKPTGKDIKGEDV